MRGYGKQGKCADPCETFLTPEKDRKDILGKLNVAWLRPPTHFRSISFYEMN